INGQLFPVFVQLKLRPTPVKRDDEQLGYKVVKKDMTDLSKYCPTDKTMISIVVAYPARAVDYLIVRANPIFEGLNQVDITIDESNIGKIFPQSHIDFLDKLLNTRIKRQAAFGLEGEDGLKRTKL
ncbi:hypothetical protein BGX23_008682, partial [Mortierella sp. AD031]